MRFRKAKLTDTPAVMGIINDAVARMLQLGRKQWNENYPALTHILADITAGNGYVLESEGRVIAYGAVVFTGEPAYEELDGCWLSDEPYVMVHRLAVALDRRGRGAGAAFMRAVENLAASSGVGSFRVDTNYDNVDMLALLEKLGFDFCGLVRYESGERRAYEKLI